MPRGVSKKEVKLTSQFSSFLLTFPVFFFSRLLSLLGSETVVKMIPSKEPTRGFMCVFLYVSQGGASTFNSSRWEVSVVLSQSFFFCTAVVVFFFCLLFDVEARRKKRAKREKHPRHPHC